MSLTFKLKMFFFCSVSFSNLRHGICCCINTEASMSIHISARSTALLKAVFHVPLLYFEHLPLQRSLHSPAIVYYIYAMKYKCHCHLMLDVVNKLPAIKLLILKSLKMVVLRICLRSQI